jgi:hypothetical protein
MRRQAPYAGLKHSVVSRRSWRRVLARSAVFDFYQLPVSNIQRN